MLEDDSPQFVMSQSFKFDSEQGPLNQDSTDMNECLFGQFWAAYFIPKKNKGGQLSKYFGTHL
jgi:hypothetical protein